jgi:molybdopterin converting factor small subunit
MSVKVRVATSLRSHVEGRPYVLVQPGTVRECVIASGLGPQIIERGELVGSVSVFVNDDDVRFLEQGLDVQVYDGDELSVLVAVAGG